MTRALLRDIDNQGVRYQALMFWCPGCDFRWKGAGLHMLPVNTVATSPSWDFDGNLDAPTISPSILTKLYDREKHHFICHSFLRAGRFEYLSDCTHPLANQTVELPELPEWALK